MTRLNIMEARKVFGDTINRVAYGKERIVLQRRGQDVAAIVSMEDLRLFEQFLEEYEDSLDLDAAREALEEPGEVSYEETRRKLGLE